MLELLWREAVDEGLRAVDRDHGDVILIFSEQLIIRFDVDLLQGELIVDAGAPDCRFGLVAEVAAGARIDDYVGLHKLSSCQLIGKLGINSAADHILINIRFLCLGAALFMFKLIIRFTAQRGIPEGVIV